MYIPKKDLKRILLNKFKYTLEPDVFNNLKHKIYKNKFPAELLHLLDNTLRVNVEKHFKIINETRNNYNSLLEEIIDTGKTDKIPKRDISLVKLYTNKFHIFQQGTPMYFSHVLWLYIFKSEIFHPLVPYLPGQYFKLLKKYKKLGIKNRIYSHRFYPVDIYYTDLELTKVDYYFRDLDKLEILYNYVVSRYIESESFKNILKLTKNEFFNKIKI